MGSSIQMAEFFFAGTAAAGVTTAATASTALKNCDTKGKRRLRLRVSCDNAYEVYAALGDAPMAALTDGVPLAKVVGAATTGKGAIHDIDVGGFAFVAVAIKNTGADASDVSAAGKLYDPD